MRVLVVEDDPVSRLTLREYLVLREHEVRVAASCAEALREAAELMPEVLVSDVRLPDGDALDMAREIATAYSAGVVLVTGLPADQMQARTAGLPRWRLLEKPLVLAELDRVLAEVAEV